MSELNELDPTALRARRRNRLQLIVIMSIAAVSLGGSYLLFQATKGGAVWGTTNNGEWVQPALAAADLDLRGADDAAVSLEPLWWIWVVSDQECHSACDEAVFKMRQLHVLLNKEADRVRRALIAPRSANAQLREDFPKLERWNVPPATANTLVPGIYLVDPLGNLVLRYPLDSEGKPVIGDLKRLLKVSQIG